MQQTWLSALKSPPREQAAVRTWLRRVMRRHAWESHRTTERRDRGSWPATAQQERKCSSRTYFKESWRSEAIGESWNTHVHHRGHLYGYDDAFLTCVDAASGEPRWKSRAPGEGFLILVDDHLVMLTRTMARELGPDIRVNAVAPGAILWPENMDEVTKQRIISKTTLKRRGDPDDIARTVLFLIRDATYMSGQVLTVDGGRSLCN